MKRKSVISLSSSELDELVKKHLGYKDYDFVAVEECNNDSSHEFDVDGKVDTCGKSEIEKWKAGKGETFTNATILNELARLGHIEKGEYIVEVCW
jgi:hypothetical protein